MPDAVKAKAPAPAPTRNTARTDRAPVFMGANRMVDCEPYAEGKHRFRERVTVLSQRLGKLGADLDFAPAVVLRSLRNVPLSDRHDLLEDGDLAVAHIAPA